MRAPSLLLRSRVSPRARVPSRTGLSQESFPATSARRRGNGPPQSQVRDGNLAPGSHYGDLSPRLGLAHEGPDDGNGELKRPCRMVGTVELRPEGLALQVRSNAKVVERAQDRQRVGEAQRLNPGLTAGKEELLR